MTNTVRIAVLLSGWAATWLSSAQVGHTSEPEEVYRPPRMAVVGGAYGPGDVVASVVAGLGGSVAGLFIGAGVGSVIDSRRMSGDIFSFSEGTIAGAATGFVLGSATGVYAYGELSGRSGNYWAALGGAAIGTGVSVGFVLLTKDSTFWEAGGDWLGMGLAVLLPSIGATVGYLMTLDEEEISGPVPGGGLLNVDGGALVLGVPEVSFRLRPDGGLDGGEVRLLSGRF